MKRDKPFALLLVQLLFFQYADLIIGCVQPPVLDIHVELRQGKIRPDRVAVKNAEVFVIAVTNLTCLQDVTDQPLTIGLHPGAVLGPDVFLQMNLGFKIAPLQKYFIETVISKRQKKSLLTAHIFIRFKLRPSALAAVNYLPLLDINGRADQFTCRQNTALHIVAFHWIAVKIAKIRQDCFCICAECRQRLG